MMTTTTKGGKEMVCFFRIYWIRGGRFVVFVEVLAKVYDITAISHFGFLDQ